MQLYNMEALAKKLVTEYETTTEKINHMGLRGGAREDLLKDVIRQLIPERFRVGSGIIVDLNETQSKQQDLFIFDAFNSPVFLKTESESIIPVESVYATVEVKSTLTKETLQQSIDNIRSVKELRHSELQNSPILSSRHNVIMGCIFAYTSDSTIETVARNVHEICTEIPKEQQPNIVCVFDKGLIVNVLKNNFGQIAIDPSDETMWGLVKNEQGTNLYLFYLLLQQHLSMAQNFPPDMMKYAAATHKLDNIQVAIPKEMIPDDMTIRLGKEELNAEEIRVLDENNQLLYKLLTGTMSEEEYRAYGKSSEEIQQITNKFKEIFQRTIVQDNHGEDGNVCSVVENNEDPY